MRSTLFFLTMLAVCSLPFFCSAQLYLGVEGGLNKNYLNTTSENQPFTQYQGRTGFSLALPVQYRISDWLSIQVEPGYIQKNYSIVRSGFFQGIYQNNTNGYIQLPVMAHFSFGGSKLRGFLNLGGYGAYWVSGRVQGAEPNILNPVDNSVLTNQQPANDFDLNNAYNYNEKYSFDSRKDQRLEWGWVAGAGVSYALGSSLSLFMEARYMQSLTDQQKDYMINQIPRYNETYGLTLGCMYPLSKLIPVHAKSKPR
jgi:opacity protein-like surface antigen